jgi:hypothetical protein
MFVVAVLAVIGIGVGVVAATTNQKIYGPSWGRFTAAFNGQVYDQRGRSSVRVGNACSSTSSSCSALRLTFPYSSYSNQPRPEWTGYLSPGYVTEWVVVDPGVVMRAVVAAAKPGLLGPGTAGLEPAVTEVEQRANGFSVVTLGPQCEPGFCMGERVVSNRQVVWVISAASGAAGPLDSFLDSFQPIG